jgi:2-ketocyclohexanecarboxyl-CoA hydrolase
MGFQALALYLQSAEHREGVAAFREKRRPEFRKFVR